LKEANWKEETSEVKKLLIQKDLIDPFDKVTLEKFDKFTRQVHLNNLAQTRCRDRVLQMRAYLRDILLRLSIRTSSRRIRVARLEFQPNYARPTKQR
jgi:hypothetical protein